MKRRKMSTPRKSKVRRQRDPIPWKYCFLTLICGLALVVGFFWAAKLHFSSMDFGIKNAKLRREIETLNTEKRRLILRREMALSRINKAAYKIGFRPRTMENIEVVNLKKTAERAPIIASTNVKDKPIKAFTNTKPVLADKRIRLKDIEEKLEKKSKNKKSLENPGKKGPKNVKRIPSETLIARK